MICAYISANPTEVLYCMALCLWGAVAFIHHVSE
jgi:hypothetical protein